MGFRVILMQRCAVRIQIIRICHYTTPHGHMVSEGPSGLQAPIIGSIEDSLAMLYSTYTLLSAELPFRDALWNRGCSHRVAVRPLLHWRCFIKVSRTISCRWFFAFFSWFRLENRFMVLTLCNHCSKVKALNRYFPFMWRVQGTTLKAMLNAYTA